MLNDSPLSAGLGKRLSEAADGFRDGLYHYFISINQFPFYLLTPPGATSDSAAREIGEAELVNAKAAYPNRNYELFGPYLTPVEASPPDYDAIEVRYLKNDPGQGSSVVRSFTYTDIDAIVFNLSAFDKFILPYYVRLYGPQVAAEIRERWNQQNTSTAKEAAPHGTGTITLRGVSEF